jgi:hypothetical protein
VYHVNYYSLNLIIFSFSYTESLFESGSFYLSPGFQKSSPGFFKHESGIFLDRVRVFLESGHSSSPGPSSSPVRVSKYAASKFDGRHSNQYI